ncbi:nitric oxide reductase activation protein NorD [Methanolobus bombayensis]|uniref:nitric oxide reductase activation protein NorD n=1 Tax=Methanolobus bombayensis TaxID=38023 RepID=UPI001AE2BD8F|nr:VWA domain-containing protein [Methanolobus bombayensis]MBP1908459.1 hypothetical protein [Methanolobus bombayensis]
MSNKNTVHDDSTETKLLQQIASNFPGRNYQQNFLSVLKSSSSVYHGELLRTARMLLDKNWMLAGLFFENISFAAENTNPEGIRKWAGIGIKIFDKNKDFAITYFSCSAPLLEKLDLSELEEWALNGLSISEKDQSLGKSYFSLKSEASQELIEKLTGSVALSEIINILRYYALGLSGVNFNILSRTALGKEFDGDSINPVIAGNTIYLAPRIKKYAYFEDNFKIYKLSIMHEVGHIHFISNELERDGTAELMTEIRRRYSTMKKRLPLSGMQAEGIIAISDVISLFPNQDLAGTILGVLEDARVEYMIMERYRGVRGDLEKIRYQMLLTRPVPKGNIEEFMEALLWISIGHEPVYDLNKGTKLLLAQIRPLLEESVFRDDSSVLDSFKATFNIYKILDEHEGPLSQKEYGVLKNLDYRGVSIGAYNRKNSLSACSNENIIRNFIPESKPELTEEQELLHEEKAKFQPTYAEKKNWNILGSYMYDEWDGIINDYKTDWCTVNEVEPFGMSGGYYDEASEQYRNEIALIKQVFSRMRPETFRRMKKQSDGTEIDIDSCIDSIIQKKCGVNPDDGLYMRWDKHDRDVATLFLVDVSYSTHKPVNFEEKSILDVEKDSLIIMTQALESIGDSYGIYAFSGKDRDDVEYFAIKEFEEDLSDNVARRISVLEPVSNTRLGPAIRHSIRKLERIDAKTKIIILLSDGEPFDISRGENAYKESVAEEDTRIAIMESNSKGINLFCITVDPDPGKYLDNIFSDSEYTIIDDASLLPETLPVLYKRITT